ncbi:hypothetical protein D1872_250800 [compost metagenome]
MAAFSASRLVCSAISSITSIISPIRLESSSKRRTWRLTVPISSIERCTTVPPSAAIPAVLLVNSDADAALAATALIAPDSSLNSSLIVCTEYAWSPLPEASSSALAEICWEAAATWAAF